jgi:hypothetical protein
MGKRRMRTMNEWKVPYYESVVGQFEQKVKNSIKKKKMTVFVAECPICHFKFESMTEKQAVYNCLSHIYYKHIAMIEKKKKMVG